MTVEHGSSLDSTETSPTGEVAEAPVDEESTRAGPLGTIGRSTRRCWARWRRPVATATLVAAAIGLPVLVFFFLYRPDQQIDDGAAQQAIQAASDGAVATLSYTPATFDRDFAAAKSHLTGDFLTYYDKFAGQFVRPMAQQKQISATTKVVRAAVSELHPDSAVVLVFIDQNTASKEKPEPLVSKSSVVVTLRKVDGAWLIAKFDPVG